MPGAPRRLEAIIRVFPSGLQPSSQLSSFPPSVMRCMFVPSGWIKNVCSFNPPPGAAETASQSLVGDQSTAVTGFGISVTRLGQPPSALTVHTSGVPVRSQITAKRLPSGENVGFPQRLMRDMLVTNAVRSSFNACPTTAVEIARMQAAIRSGWLHGVGRSPSIMN